MADPHHPVVTDGEANFVENATVHADADAQAYVHGSMPLNEQHATYGLFMNLTKWGSLGVAALVLFLTLWFHPGGNLIAAVICAAVLIVAGIIALKTKPEHAL
ncbi:aa3-type cytochrome c oxidase subunit IV [Brevundimonas sp. PAMC22021]|uniref:aa3-type cytochrome c oxidase subunit IV n=1 Tax=Brevundimonas sp. PAMC22021 TaxID=2861285 RepID=UPI0021085147|nr:aa3-type cytochrome c oxidase subunit IV [Brevundimonas sp. PAMC22021]